MNVKQEGKPIDKYVLFPDIEFVLENAKFTTGEDETEIRECIERLNRLLVPNTSLWMEMRSAQSRFLSEKKAFQDNAVNREQFDKTLIELARVLNRIADNLQYEDLEIYQILNTPLFLSGPQKNLDEQLLRSQKPLTVYLKGSQNQKSKFHKIYNDIDSTHLVFDETPNTEVEYTLALHNDQLLIEDGLSGQLIHGIKKFNDATVQHIKTKLEAIEKTNRIFSLDNESSFSQDVDFVLFEKHQEDRFTKHEGSKIQFTFPPYDSNKKDKRIDFELKAINNSKQTFFLSCWYITNDFGITNISKKPLYAKRDLLLADNYFFLSSDETFSKERLLLIVSTNEFEDHHLEEENIALKKIVDLPMVRSIGGRGDFNIRQETTNPDWFVKKITVELKRDRPENEKDVLDFNLIYQLISESKLRQVLDYLTQNLNGDNTNQVNEFVHLQNRFEQLRSNERKGIMSDENIRIEYNKFTNSLLNFVTELEPTMEPIKYSNQNVSEISDEIKDDLYNHLKEDQLEKVFLVLKKNIPRSDKDNYNYVLLINSRFSRIQKNFRIDHIISSEEYNVVLNQIRQGLLELIKSL